MQKSVNLEPVELNDAELIAVAGGQVSITNSLNFTNSFNNSFNITALNSFNITNSLHSLISLNSLIPVV
jgi:hypothetical protein